MRTRPLSDMLTDVVGSLLDFDTHRRMGENILRATSVELTLPVDVRVRHLRQELLFCADVPAWRWRTDWDAPFGQLHVTLGQTREEKPHEWL